MMNIISQGEDVSNSTVHRIVTSSINKFKSMEESDTTLDRGGAPEESSTQPSKSSVDTQKLSKYEIWKMKINILREFSIPNPNSSHAFNDHIEFLESVKKYVSLDNNNN